MKTINTCLLATLALITLGACEEEQELTKNHIKAEAPLRNTTIGGSKALDESGEGESYPFPTVIHQTFVPDYYWFEHTKCLTWKISWPDYSGGYNQYLIPTVLSLPEGDLHSFNFLNQNSASNTHKATFSLYYENTLESAVNMWMQLDYAGIGNGMETTRFRKFDKSVSDIAYMVQERPSLFETYWESSNLEEVSYQSGDFFLFKMVDAGLYGGIRIVSMTPRIIEVYLAVPHDEQQRPETGPLRFK